MTAVGALVAALERIEELERGVPFLAADAPIGDKDICKEPCEHTWCLARAALLAFNQRPDLGESDETFHAIWDIVAEAEEEPSFDAAAKVCDYIDVHILGRATP